MHGLRRKLIESNALHIVIFSMVRSIADASNCVHHYYDTPVLLKALHCLVLYFYVDMLLDRYRPLHQQVKNVISFILTVVSINHSKIHAGF